MRSHASRAIGAAAIAVVALCAGCGSSGKSGSASPSTAPGTTIPAPPHSGTSVPGTTAGGPGSTRPPSTADLAGLKQDLGAAGASLDGANGALAQSDPNQTKNEEGSAP